MAIIKAIMNQPLPDLTSILNGNVDPDTINCRVFGELENRLFAAAQKNDASTVRKTIVDGVDVNIANHQGMTPLMLAAEMNNFLCIDALLENGALIDSQDNQGRTALFHAAQHRKNGHGAIISLLANNADVNMPDEQGWTPLMIAVARGDVQTIERLFDAGADINQTNEEGKSSVDLSKERSWDGILARLMDTICEKVAMTEKQALDQVILYDTQNADVGLCF